MENVLLITDPNSDPDDLACMVLLSRMIEEGKINLCGVIACKGKAETRQLRAKFSRVILSCLGLKEIPVAVGGDYVRRPGYGDDSFYLGRKVRQMLSQTEDVDCSATELTEAVLGKHDEVTLLIISPMNDVADFIAYNPKLFQKKIKKIVIMGGCKDETGCPDEKPYNNAVCYEAAFTLWQFATANNIRLIWVPRESVYQAQVKRDFYDNLALIPHLIAQILLASNKKLLEMLWEDIHCGRFSHFDIMRFAKVFLGEERGLIKSQEDFSSVWPKIRFFNLYDPVAALALDEELFSKAGYFEPCRNNKNVLIAKISDAEAVRFRLYNGIIGQIEKKQKEEK